MFDRADIVRDVWLSALSGTDISCSVVTLEQLVSLKSLRALSTNPRYGYERLGQLRFPGRNALISGRITLTRRFDHDEVPEMRRKTHTQACARRKAISAQTRMLRARVAAGKTATDSNEIPQGPTELVGIALLRNSTSRIEAFQSGFGLASN